MITDADIQRAAKELVERHGDSALVIAGEHVAARSAVDDQAGMNAALRVVSALEELLAGDVERVAVDDAGRAVDVGYMPDGKVDLTVPLPAVNVTSCMFGGADLATLYVTTAASGLSKSERQRAPLSGSLFAIETGFTGLPEPVFAG